MKFNTILIAASLVLLISCQTTKKETTEVATTPEVLAPQMTKIWETDTIMTTSESVIYDAARDRIYVANINGVPPTKKDNDGFISILSTSGEVIEHKWVTGISAPKGMAIKDSSLFVANIDEVVEINIETGEIIKRYAGNEGIFFNDITATEGGDLYISDSYKNEILQLKNDTLTVWMSDTTLGNPNGLLAQGSQLMMIAYGSGDFYRFDLKSKARSILTDSIMGGDGIIALGDDYLVSSWNGEVYHVSKEGIKTLLLDTKADKINAADIWFIESKNLVLVPTFFGNTVAAYELK